MARGRSAIVVLQAKVQSLRNYVLPFFLSSCLSLFRFMSAYLLLVFHILFNGFRNV